MAVVRPLDPVALRADFPIFEREFRGRRLVYLDSAATALKPRHRDRRPWTAYMNEYSANVHRGIYEIGEEATAAYEAARVKIAAFIGAADPREIVMVRNATEAINLVAYAWGRRNIGRADTIVLTELEHHSNLVPWQLLAQEKDADLEFVPFDDAGPPDPGQLRGTPADEAQARSVHARVERRRHHQPGRRDGPQGS